MSTTVILGVLLALATSISWAFGNVFIQKSSRAVGSPRAMLWALVAGGLLAGGLSGAFEERTAPVTLPLVAWTLAAGLAGVVAYVCLFHALEHASLSVAIPLVSSWALVSGAFSLGVLGERPGPRQLAGAALVLAGVVMVAIGASREPASAGGTGRSARAGLWAAFGSAAGFGVMVPVMTARVAPVFGAFGSTALVYAMGVILVLPLALALETPLRPPPRAAWAVVLLTGCFETFGFVCLAFAQRFAPTAVVTPVASLAAALTILYAWVVLRERPHRAAALGAVLASVGIVVLSG